HPLSLHDALPILGPAPSPKTFTLPSGCLNTPVCTLPVSTACPPSCQFVGHWKPLDTLNGKAEVQRYRPEICHPPMIASKAPPAFLPRDLPLPKGSSMIQLALNWCVAS